MDPGTIGVYIFWGLVAASVLGFFICCFIWPEILQPANEWDDENEE